MFSKKSTFESLVLALRGSPVTIYFQDMDGRFVWFENEQTIWGVNDLVGAPEDAAFTTDSISALQKARETCTTDKAPCHVVVTALPAIVSGGDVCHLKVTMQPAFDEYGNQSGYLCSSVDITLERMREQTLKTLFREVAHRSKNMLAMVLSISAQTARHTASKDGFIRALTGRIQSLAKSQDAITESDWAGARFRELVDQQVLSVASFGNHQISVKGINPNLSPNAAVHAGLALHELLTNALIHGVLSAQKGRIEIECSQITGAGESPQLQIVWSEGPIKDADKLLATNQGFGRRLLERVVPSAVSGTGELSIKNDRLEYRLIVGSQDFT